MAIPAAATAAAMAVVTEVAAGSLAWLEGRMPAEYLAQLRSLLGGPDRHYHGIDHVETLWERHLAHGGSPGDDVMAFAIAYHDAIYDARRSDNEKKSAQLWVQHATEAGHPDRVVLDVTRAILATALHPFQDDAPAHVLRMVDLDLLGLASDSAEFAKDTENVAKEFHWVSPKDFVAGRRQFFARMLDAPVLYRTAEFHALYEDKARANLRAAVAGGVS